MTISHLGQCDAGNGRTECGIDGGGKNGRGKGRKGGRGNRGEKHTIRSLISSRGSKHGSKTMAKIEHLYLPVRIAGCNWLL